MNYKIVKIELPFRFKWKMDYGPEWFINNNIGKDNWKWNKYSTSKKEKNFIIIDYKPEIHDNIIKTFIKLYGKQNG